METNETILQQELDHGKKVILCSIQMQAQIQLI